MIMWISACLDVLYARLLGQMHLRHQTQRINHDPTLHYLKMQGETCAVAGIAYITYNLPCRYCFTCDNGSLHHMA